MYFSTYEYIELHKHQKFLVINVYRLKELEAAAEQLQAALLAELNAPAPGAGGSSRKKAKAKKAKKKQVGITGKGLHTVRCIANLWALFACNSQPFP